MQISKKLGHCSGVLGDPEWQWTLTPSSTSCHSSNFQSLLLLNQFFFPIFLSRISHCTSNSKRAINRASETVFIERVFRSSYHAIPMHDLRWLRSEWNLRSSLSMTAVLAESDSVCDVATRYTWNDVQHPWTSAICWSYPELLKQTALVHFSL